MITDDDDDLDQWEEAKKWGKSDWEQSKQDHSHQCIIL